jgi:hypothetical protein
MLSVAAPAAIAPSDASATVSRGQQRHRIAPRKARAAT